MKRSFELTNLIIAIIFLLILFRVANAAKSTYLDGVILENNTYTHQYHEDGTFHQSPYNGWFLKTDHRIHDLSKSWTIRSNSYYFSGPYCWRDSESHEVKLYDYNCGNTWNNSYSSDSGLICQDQYFYSLNIFSGSGSGYMCGVSSCADCCSVPPASNYFIDEMDTSFVFVLDCQDSSYGKNLHIESRRYSDFEQAQIISATQPTGREFLINGFPPSLILQRNLYYFPCYPSYRWEGELEWDIPINVKCGEKITVIPSIANGRAYADLTYIGVTDYTKIEIVSPVNNDDFDLTASNQTATPPVNYHAHAASNTVDWNVAVSYRTSGGKCEGCDVTKTFQSPPDVDHPETFTSMGGQVTVNASALIDGTQVSAEPVVHTITGVEIPPSEISDKLVSLYNGFTKRLMTGLAMKESTYMQFSKRTLYGLEGLWPRESPTQNSGVYIGLMQVKTTIDRAWNWQKNVEYGVTFFTNEKIAMARLWETRIKNEAKTKYKCQLRNLTDVERENMAILLYNGAPPAELITGQFYYYQVTTNRGKTTCDWIENTQGNMGGVTYVNSVRDYCASLSPTKICQ